MNKSFFFALGLLFSLGSRLAWSGSFSNTMASTRVSPVQSLAHSQFDIHPDFGFDAGGRFSLNELSDLAESLRMQYEPSLYSGHVIHSEEELSRPSPGDPRILGTKLELLLFHARDGATPPEATASAVDPARRAYEL
jgi:hypothetical protein